MSVSHLELARCSSKISHIALRGSLEESRPATERNNLSGCSARIWGQALIHLERAHRAGEFSRPASTDLLEELRQQQKAESKKFRRF